MNKLAYDSMNFIRKDVAGAMPDYEPRHSQLEMMKACSEIIDGGGVLMAEAGTGTGKTFAYLIPIIFSGKQAIVTTKTINLQEQLVSKDLKFLAALKGFDYAIAKGRGNYLCLRRLNAFRTSDADGAEEYGRLANWASMTDTGDKIDCVFENSSIWDKVCSDADACKRLKCGFFSRCFYFKARQKWAKAQIVVANHALIAINAFMPDESKILSDAEVLVIDEGHALDHVLTDKIGIDISKRGFENILNRLLRLDERGAYKGLLSKSPHLFHAVESLKIELELLWKRIKSELKDRETIKDDFSLKDLISVLSGYVRELAEKMRTSTKGLFKEDEELELKSEIIKLRTLADEMEIFSNGREGFVRWAGIEENRICLRMSPVYPRDFVRENIMPKHRSIIITSATLSVSGDFGLIENVLGFEDAKRIAVPSPFDFKKQVEVKVKNGIDLLTEDGVVSLAAEIIDEVSEKDGGVLILFTSRDVMKKTWELTSGVLTEMGVRPMLQGELPSSAIVETMRGSDNCIVFGLDSFWEGIDVKGDALKCLIITKLPFDVPTEPITKARTDLIERDGGNPFREYSLPRAVLKFKQGFGRLIRSKTDTGRIIICDERIETKSYGREFLKNIC
jgi:ATP-dependent DNA helicase DinG